MTTGATFCVPSFTPLPSALGKPYAASTTTSSLSTPPAVLPAIKL
jgi:hypothetical protein